MSSIKAESQIVAQDLLYISKIEGNISQVKSVFYLWKQTKLFKTWAWKQDG